MATVDTTVKYRVVLGWLSAVVLFRAADLGMQVADRVEFAADPAAAAFRIVELAFHMVVLAGVWRRAAWGWITAAVWIPLWIGVMSFDLWQAGGLILCSLWSMHFMFSAMALRFLLRDSVRESFGVRGAFWASAQWWLGPLSLSGALVVPCALVFGPGPALAFWLTVSIASGTRLGSAVP